MAYATNDELFPVWREPRSFWERTGLTPEQQRRLDYALVGLVGLLLAGWIYSVALALSRGEVPTIARLRRSSIPTPPRWSPTWRA